MNPKEEAQAQKKPPAKPPKKEEKPLPVWDTEPYVPSGPDDEEDYGSYVDEPVLGEQGDDASIQQLVPLEGEEEQEGWVLVKAEEEMDYIDNIVEQGYPELQGYSKEFCFENLYEVEHEISRIMVMSKLLVIVFGEQFLGEWFLGGCLLGGCLLGGCLLGGCALGGCLLSGCALSGCLFDQCLLAGYLFGQCLLDGCLFGQCLLDGCALGGWGKSVC